MIYIKTEMKQMPKGCKECKNHRNSSGIGFDYNLCGLSTKEIKLTNTRPDWCPLIEIEEKPK